MFSLSCLLVVLASEKPPFVKLQYVACFFVLKLIKNSRVNREVCTRLKTLIPHYHEKDIWMYQWTGRTIGWLVGWLHLKKNRKINLFQTNIVSLLDESFGSCSFTRTRSAGSAASTLVSGIATHKMTTSYQKWRQEHGNGSGTKIQCFRTCSFFSQNRIQKFHKQYQ